MSYSAKGMLHSTLLLLSFFYPASASLSETVKFDYTGDKKADVVLRRPSDFSFVDYRNDENSVLGLNSLDIPVAGDFDGDGLFDVAVRRPSNSMWYIRNSGGTGNNDLQRIQFGMKSTDIPVVGDYDGDGISDVAVRRPSTHMWYIRNSSGTVAGSTSNDGIQRVKFGKNSADIPVPADYNGDGITDIAVRRPSNSMWYILNSAGDLVNYNSSNNDGIQRVKFGLRSDDIPVPADYDGDGIDDIAVRRPSNSMWYIKSSLSGEIIRIRFGLKEDDIPMVADYDGDGKADVAVRRVSNNHVYIRRSSDQRIDRIEAGLLVDIPVAAPITEIMAMVQSSPVNQDSDADGLNDYEEQYTYQTDPNNADSDGDGLSDYDEVNTYDTDPILADTDNDGINDGQEIAEGSDPNWSIYSSLTDYIQSADVVLDWPTVDIKDGFFPNYLDVLNFDEDGSVTVTQSYHQGNTNRHELSWVSDDYGDLSITGYETRVTNFYSYYPYDEVREKWGDEAADTLVLAYEQGHLYSGSSFEVLSQIIEDNYQAIGVINEGYGVLRTTTKQETLQVPEAVFELFEGDIFTLRSVTQSTRIINHISESLPNIWTEIEQTTDWVLPVYYSLEDQGTLLNSNLGPDFRHDRLSFDGTVARTEISQLEFNWNINERTLTLSNEEGTHTYWILKTQGTEYQVVARFVNNEQAEFWYSSTMQSYQSADLDIQSYLVSELPVIQASYHFGWNNSEYLNDEVLLPENLFGFQFLPDGKMHYAITIDPETAHQAENIYFGTEMQYNIDESDSTVTIVYNDGTYFFQRNWYILNVDDNQRMSYLEYSYLSVDINGDGEIDESELKQYIQPRIMHIKSVSLAAYGDVWDLLDLDEDGLNNGLEAEAGTDINVMDTDGDGLSDYDEVMVHETDPLSSDSDNDGLSDQDEIVRGSDPNSYSQGNFSSADVVGKTSLLLPRDSNIRNGFVPLSGEVYEFNDAGQVTWHNTANQGFSEKQELSWQVDDGGFIVVSGFETYATFTYPQTYYYPFYDLASEWGEAVATQLRTAYEQSLIDYHIYVEVSSGTYAHILSKSDTTSAGIAITRSKIGFDAIEIPQDIIDTINTEGDGWQGDSKLYQLQHQGNQDVRLQAADTVDYIPFTTDLVQSDWSLAHRYSLQRFSYSGNTETSAIYWDLFSFSDNNAQSQIAGIDYQWQIDSDGVLHISNEDVSMQYQLIMQNENTFFAFASIEAEGTQQYVMGQMVMTGSDSGSFIDNLITDIPEIYSSVLSGWHNNNWNADVYDPELVFGYYFRADEFVNRGVFIDTDSDENLPVVDFGERWTWESLTEERQVIMYRPENQGQRTWEVLDVDSQGKAYVLEYSVVQYDSNYNGEIDAEESGYLMLPRINIMQKVDLSKYEAWGNTDYDGDSLTNAEEAQYGTDIYNHDTDGDGVYDGLEVETGYDPTVANNFVDFQLFSDYSLENCVRQTGQNYRVLTTEEVTELDCFDAGAIYSLAGLEQLVHLERFAGIDLAVDDYSVFAQLPELKVLFLFFSEIPDATFLTELTQLERLSLQYSTISDFSSLPLLTNLQWLSLSNTSFDDLTLITELPVLTSLHLASTQISDYSALSTMINLQYLSLRGSQFSDASLLSELVNLETLDVSLVDSITDYAPILALPSLTGLDLSDTKMENIEVFQQKSNWQFIGFGGMSLSAADLSFLAEQSEVQRLWLDNNQLNNLSELSAAIEHLPITSLDLSRNDITELNGIEALEGLEYLYLYSNDLYDITPLRSLPALKRVVLSYNYSLYCSDLAQFYEDTGVEVVFHNCSYENRTGFTPDTAATSMPDSATGLEKHSLWQMTQGKENSVSSYRDLPDHLRF